MAFFLPKHSSAATARLTEQDPDTAPPMSSSSSPTKLPTHHRHSRPSQSSPNNNNKHHHHLALKHRRLESIIGDNDNNDENNGLLERLDSLDSHEPTKSTSFSSESSSETDSEEYDSDDINHFPNINGGGNRRQGGGDDDDDQSSLHDTMEGYSLTDGLSDYNGNHHHHGDYGTSNNNGNDNGCDNDDDGMSVTSTSTNNTHNSLLNMIGEYNDGDLQTLNNLVNKLHAAELRKNERGGFKSKKNGGGGGGIRHCLSDGGDPINPLAVAPSPPSHLDDLPSQLPTNNAPPTFSPLQSSHRLSISAVDSWRGPSLEVIPTEDVNGILPMWNAQWTEDRLEWEEECRKQSIMLSGGDLKLKRSHTHNDVKDVGVVGDGDGGSRCRNDTIGLNRRNHSMPNTTNTSQQQQQLTRTFSQRSYRYGKPPTLPNAKNPNPMVSKSSKKIHKKHARYALTAGMMLGIRESVGGAMGVEAELEISNWEGWERSWLEQDEEEEEDENSKRSSNENDEKNKSQSSTTGYDTLTTECSRVSKYKFPPHQFYLGSNTPAKPLPHKYKFKVYAPLIFGRIRSLFGVEKQTFLHSICGKFNFYEFASNARSGQFFFYSHDGRYMIKTLTFTESKFLREILPYYYKHLTRYPSTFLSHFYGMYRVAMPNANNQRLHFIIMRSVFHTEKKIDKVWDLKGSTAGRRANEGDGVGKDLNILEEGRKLRFRDSKARGKFLEQLARDATFLARLGIMDYSLLLGLHKCREGGDNGGDGGGGTAAAPVNGGGAEDIGRDANNGGGDGGASSAADVTPSTPRQKNQGQEEPSRSNTPFRRCVLQRASSAGDTKVGNDGFKALEACNEDSSSSDLARDETTTTGCDSVPTSSASSSGLNAIPESPSCESQTSSSKLPKNAITSRLDSGIEGYGVKLEDGTLADREIYFCGIIDILQYYNARKMGETVIRKAAGNSGQDISCVDPETYGKRFVKFISNLVEE